MANVGNDHALGMELSGQFIVNKWWNLNVNGNVYYYKVVNNINSGGKEETSTNYDITVNNLLRICKNTRIQLDGNFVGPSVTTQGRSDFSGLSIWLFASNGLALICSPPCPFGIYLIPPVIRMTSPLPIWNRSHIYDRNSRLSLYLLATPLIISNGVHKIHGITETYLKESITKKAIFTAIKLFNYETTI